MGLLHFKPDEQSIVRKIFLHLYAKFEILYIRLNWLILKYAYSSRFWRTLFLPFIYLNVFLMLRWGQHGKVMHIEEIKSFLQKQENLEIAIGSCRCRLGTPDICDCAMKADITIKTGAEIYLTHHAEDYERISRQEAIARIKKCTNQGLIPIAYSFCLCGGAQNVFVLCNCCVHACIPLLAQKIGNFHMIDPGDYMAQVDKEKCEGCGTCLETCQVEARSINEGFADIDPLRCLGCGACVQTCPEDASTMVPRPKKVVKEQLQPLRSFLPSHS